MGSLGYNSPGCLSMSGTKLHCRYIWSGRHNRRERKGLLLLGLLSVRNMLSLRPGEIFRSAFQCSDLNE